MPTPADALKYLVRTSTKLNCRFELADLALERELMETKWFGYRFMSPLKATNHFARIYADQAQKAVWRNRDREKKVKGVNWIEYYSKGPEFTMLWRARQRADRHCVPYETYITFGFDFAARRTRRRDPRPSQLHGTGCSAEAWAAEFSSWSEQRRWTDCLRLDVAQFHRTQFKGLPPQLAYRQYVVANARKALVSSGSWKRVIEVYCYERNEFDVAVFEPMIASDNLKTIMSIVDADLQSGCLEAKAPPMLEKHHFWPSCFGWPGCRDPHAAMCASCPLSASCERVTGFVTERVKELTGHFDPVKIARLDNQNERQKRCREQKRSGAAVSSSSADI